MFEADTISRVEAALVDVLASAGNLTGYTYEPWDLPPGRSLTIWGPDVEGPDVDEEKGPFGAVERILRWTCRIYMPLDGSKVRESTVAAKETLGLVLGALDSHDQLSAMLGGLVIDVAITGAELLATAEDVSPALLVWELQTSVLIHT